MYLKVGLVEETKGGGKERKVMNNDEVHHTCVGTRYKEHIENLKKKTHRIGGKG
jgi:hypothetical protein